MGDSKITLYIPKEGSNHEDVQLESISVSIPADASLYDLIQKIQAVFDTITSSSSFKVYIPGSTSKACDTPMSIIDCTLYPPIDVTSIFETHNEPKGPNSKTLFSMGWYPSGELLCLVDTRSDTDYDLVKNDFLQGRRKLFPYPQTSESDTSSTYTYSTTTQTRPCPSQLLLQATTSHRRITHPDRDTDTQSIPINNITKQKSNNTMNRMGSCTYTWDTKKHTLTSQSSSPFSNTTTTSTTTTKKTDSSKQQVLKMKIKTQCNSIYKHLISKLRDEDRFYLETIVVTQSTDDDTILESRFMVFSRMYTMAKVMTDILQDWNRVVPEISFTADIYKVQQEENNHHGNDMKGTVKLPLLKRLYELNESKILSPFEAVYVWIHPS